MQTPKWIVFDVGGVLLDWRSSSQATAKLLGVDRDTLFNSLFNRDVEMSIGAKMNIGEITAQDGWTSILKELKSEHTPDEVMNMWYAKEFWLRDTLDLLKELDTAGHQLAIMSNSWLGLTDPAKQNVFPEELQLFKYVFDSSIERVKKPDLQFYEVVEKGVGSHGQDLMLIDDDPKNLISAESKNWQTFLYDAGGNSDGTEANETLRKLLIT